MQPTLTGGCLCGAVRYEIEGKLRHITHCHCGMCRKAHGAAFATYASLARRRFRHRALLSRAHRRRWSLGIELALNSGHLTMKPSALTRSAQPALGALKDSSEPERTRSTVSRASLCEALERRRRGRDGATLSSRRSDGSWRRPPQVVEDETVKGRRLASALEIALEARHHALAFLL